MLHLIGFLIIGIVVGWLAGLLVRGRGFGLIGDMVVGVVGSLIGGFAFRQLFPGTETGRLGSFVISLLGAVLLVMILKLIRGRSPARA